MSAEREPAPDDAPPLPGVVGGLLRHVPALDALRRYSWQSLGGDLRAGLTVATVAVPQAMAHATLTGVPPQYGPAVHGHRRDGRRGPPRLVSPTHQPADQRHLDHLARRAGRGPGR
jgi:hypothetical protein